MRRLSPHRTLRTRRGATLLELLVVLLLVALGAALVAPAVRRPSSADGVEGSASMIVQRARATAVRRGETLVLDVTADGRWALRAAHADSLPIDAGVIATDGATARAAIPRRLVVTPLGLCLPDALDDEALGAWDAAACRSAAIAAR